MRMTTGESPRTRGIVLLGLILLLTGGAVGGGVALSRHARALLRDRQLREEAMIAGIAEGFTRVVSARLMIPGPESWARAVAEVTGASPAAVGSVRPERMADPSVRRLLLVDPGLGEGMLPYAQDSAGLLDPRSRLLSDHARVLLLSSSAPGLALPFGSGTPDQAAFEAIWNWVHDPATGAPPAGWPAAWKGNGADLHVARIPLKNLFSAIHFKHALHGAGGDPVSTGNVPAKHLSMEPVTTALLKGTSLVVCRTNGTIHQVRVVRSEESFDLTPPPSTDDEGDSGEVGDGKEPTP